MEKQRYLEALNESEKIIRVFTNEEKHSLFVSRMQKFFCQPIKYIQQNAYKAGLITNDNFLIKMFWGDTLLLPISDENVILMYYAGSLGLSESPLTRFIIRNVDSKTVFYDIGANFGYYSSLAHALGADVHCFEPNPSTLKYIYFNLSATEKSTIQKFAITDTSTRITLFDIFDCHKSGMSTLFPDILTEVNQKKCRPIKVDATSLDEYLNRLGWLEKYIPTCIKIDVENAESLVMAGAKKLLTDFSPIITMELYDAPAAIERTKKALEIILSYGYRPHEITSNGFIQPTSVQLGNLGTANTFVFKK